MDLYTRCREKFLVNSDTNLRAQLTEFKDHKLIKVKKVRIVLVKPYLRPSEKKIFFVILIGFGQFFFTVIMLLVYFLNTLSRN